MIRRYQLLLSICSFLLVIGLALWPERWSPPAYANVTLVRFTATSTPGQREIVIEWETATEFDTSGFFVARSDVFTGPFAKLGDLIIAEGSTIVGAQYHFTDTTTVFNRTYYYRLEVVNTNQTIDYHGPITATVGPAINTPTLTPSPTATPTTQAATEAPNSTPPSGSGALGTPRVVTGATITPRATSSSSGSASPAAVSVAPTLSSAPGGSPPPTPLAAVALAVPHAATAGAPPPPTAANVAQASAETLASTEEASALVAPVVVVTEAAPSAASINFTSSGALTLIAAFLLLGMALLILRQARR